MNDSKIVLFYDNSASKCCETYDHKFNLWEAFGQQISREDAFYMEKSMVTNAVTKFGFKYNPKIFGLTDRYMYLFNYNKVFIVNRETGLEAKKIDLSGFRPYFMLDMQNNILQVNTLEKRITLYDSELVFLAEGTYSDHFEFVHVSSKNNLIFLEQEKTNLVVL